MHAARVLAEIETQPGKLDCVKLAKWPWNLLVAGREQLCHMRVPRRHNMTGSVGRELS